MKSHLSIICLIFILSGCKLTRNMASGAYASDCRLYAEPSIVISLKRDGSCVYKWAQMKDTIICSWKIKSDTIFVSSDLFGRPSDEWSPQIKYTRRPVEDAFILKGRKLVPVSLDKTCILFRLKL